jgi:hypothetical protein
MSKMKRAPFFGVIVLALLCSPVHAAPDHSPGMALMFAVVGDDGALLRGAGATSAEPDILDGEYHVVFDRDVSGCVYTATAGIAGSRSGSGGSSLIPGVATVSSLAGVPEGVFVETYDFAGNRLSLGFHLMVFCAK